MKPWQQKAHAVIARLCRQSYLKANQGKKRHVSYSVPQTAVDLIDCLRNDDERTAKAIFIELAYQ